MYYINLSNLIAPHLPELMGTEFTCSRRAFSENHGLNEFLALGCQVFDLMVANDPTHKHMRADAQMEGFQSAPNAPFELDS
jgi:hypothetical protein